MVLYHGNKQKIIFNIQIQAYVGSKTATVIAYKCNGIFHASNIWATVQAAENKHHPQKKISMDTGLELHPLLFWGGK